MTDLDDRPDWQYDAACVGSSPDLFFPDKHYSAGRGGHPDAQAAKAICRQCPVRVECLEYALANTERHGIWGGHTVRERALILRARRKGQAA